MSSAEDWTPWAGEGKPPLHHSIFVEVSYGNGDWVGPEPVDSWKWDHTGSADDIVAYRVGEPTKGMLKNIPWFLQELALREGLRMFSLAVQVGTANEAARPLARMLAGNRKAAESLARISQVLNWLVQALLAREGKSTEDLKELNREIERLGQLAGSESAPGEAQSPGGIILSNRH